MRPPFVDEIFPPWCEAPMNLCYASTRYDCERCYDMGGNDACIATSDCSCMDCSGSEDCPECGR